ncbi:MAG TPA: hypothetical protein VHY10_04540 [Xanthobacteraceae bacterium]|nr:hypothetical protein [Xanthobacteraceae bacterium]
MRAAKLLCCAGAMTTADRRDTLEKGQAPLVLAVCIMLTAATTMILLFRYRPLSEMVDAGPRETKLAA